MNNVIKDRNASVRSLRLFGGRIGGNFGITGLWAFKRTATPASREAHGKNKQQ